MVVENGTNYCAIKEVFDVDFMVSKVVSWQIHYKSDVNKASLRLGVSVIDEFKNICNRMCTVTIVTQYNEQNKVLDEIANLFPDMATWVAKWNARKYHIFLAFRRLGYSQYNTS